MFTVMIGNVYRSGRYWCATPSHNRNAIAMCTTRRECLEILVRGFESPGLKERWRQLRGIKSKSGGL